MILNVIIWLVIVGLIISKFCDCYTTYYYVSKESETNPIGKMLMNKYGAEKVSIGIFVLSIIIIIVTAYPAMIDDGYLFYKIGFNLTGILTIICQFGVAYTNKTGKFNVVTIAILHFHEKFASLFHQIQN